jgi:hypothetical protein
MRIPSRIGTFHLPPQQTGPYAPGGYTRDHFGPELNDEQWNAAVCRDWQEKSR